MKHIFKNYLRFLQRNKTLSVINIGGFAISMFALFIIISFVVGEKSVNMSFPNGKNIYRITRTDSTSKTTSIVPTSLFEDVKNTIPDVEAMGFYTINEAIVKYMEKPTQTRLAAINNDFVRMFSFDFISQMPRQLLDTKENTIITESYSKKVFGNTESLGKILYLGDKPLTIVGVIKDLPKNASFKFEMAIHYDMMNVMTFSYRTSNSTPEQHYLVNAFIQLKPKTDVSLVNKKIAGMVSHWGAFKKSSLKIEPLRKVYFNAVEKDQMSHANVKLVYLLASIAVIILFMSIFNYVNLTISKSYDRLNEIGIKKANGADKKEIFKQLMTESFLVSFIAMAIAVALAALFSGAFSSFLGQEIHLDALISQPFFVAIIGSIIIFTAVISGIYPAVVFSRVTPLQLINKKKQYSIKRAGEWVIGLQFFFTITLIISLLLIQKQMNFVKHKNLGFDTEQLVKIGLQGEAWKNVANLKESLLSYPEISSVSGTEGTPMNTTGWSSGEYDINGVNKVIESLSFAIDKDFIKTFNIPIIKGRGISQRDSSQVCLINEHLYKEMEWKDLDGKKFGSFAVIGVTKDFNYQTLYTSMGNLVLYNTKYPNVLNVKIQGGIASALKTISKVYSEFEPNVAPEIVFYDEWIQAMYQKDENQAKGIRLFTLLAIIISCLGAVGVVEQITHRKIKEIGIRKINGAKISDILKMLNYKIMIWVVVAFVLAIPVSYVLVNKWLQTFAYKTTLSWWIFALAGIIALAIALLTVSWQSWRAASRNPVEALRYE